MGTLNSPSSRVVKDSTPVNPERTDVLLFYYCLYLKVNLDLEKTNQLGESSPNFIFAAVNLDSIVMEKNELMVNLEVTTLLKR